MRDTILFDLDETLLDRTNSLLDFLSWQVRGMLRNSIRDQSQFCRRFIELDSNGAVWKDQVYQSLVEEFNITDWSVAELLCSYELCFSGFCRLMPHSSSAIKSLYYKGYKLGLVSNGKTPFQERNFNALGLSKLFGTVIVSDAVGLSKPDPQIFLLACDELNTSPDQVIFIGDNPIADIEGANELDMFTVYIPGFHGESCDTADVVCADYRSLTGIIENAS